MSAISTADAKLGLLVMYTFDMYDKHKGTLTPPVDARLAADWNVTGYLTGNDAILRQAGGKLVPGGEVCYGLVAASKADPKQHIVVIRGTDGIVEWIEDATFAPTAHPVAGRVEQGFWGIYMSMKIQPVEGAEQSLLPGIQALTAGASSVTVVGHSLGSSLATYLAFDLADPKVLGARTSALLFASPHPGNDAFCNAFDARLKSAAGQSQYRLYNYFLDAVPRVPFGPDYAHLPGVTDLRPSDANARIRFDLGCNHHVGDYCAMLDYELTMPIINADVGNCCENCIKGRQ